MTINIDDLSKLPAETKGNLILRLIDDLFGNDKKLPKQLEDFKNEIKRENCRRVAESCTSTEREEHRRRSETPDDVLSEEELFKILEDSESSLVNR